MDISRGMDVSARNIRAFWLGRRPYDSICRLQEKALEGRRRGRIGDTILLLEHHPVITLGRSAKREHLLLSEELLAARGVQLLSTARGGDVTYHGPGQLVGYPIIDLSPDRCDVRRYVQDLLATMAGLAADQGVFAGTIDRYPGIWVDGDGTEPWPGQQSARQPAKLGAVGVRISQWITMHGFALNACTDLSGFGLIVPCGIREYDVTSLEKLRGRSPDPKALAPRAAELLCERFGTQLTTFTELDGRDDELADAIGA